MQTRFKWWTTVSALALALAGCGTSSKDDDADNAAGSGGDKGNDDAGAGSGGSAGSGGGAGTGMDDEEFPDPRNGCPDLNSGFPGDEACIAPPPEGEGMQIHIGPSNYDDPEEIAKFTVAPGYDGNECWNFHTPNGEKIYYQTYVLSSRPGTHHIINTMYITEVEDGGFVACRDGGTGMNSDIIANLPGASKPYMPRTKVAPENAKLGKPITANAASQADLHYFNFTDDDVLREFWLNVYFVPESEVDEEPLQIRGMGGFGWNANPIPMKPEEQIFAYTCPISASGRILSLLGHYHSHGKRQTAWIKRKNGERQKVFEMYDYTDPRTFVYNTITTNADFSATADGAVTGILEVEAGDSLDWECAILNDDQPDGLRYYNNVKLGEMCNIWGETLGPKINCVLP